MEQAAQIDDAALERLIPLFYQRVRADAELGPVFNDAVDDWPEHLERLVAFWSSVMLTSGRYKGNPMIAHLKHKARITPSLFDRWLALWAHTTAEVMPPAAAAALQTKAARIAESLQLALFFRLDPPATDGGAR
ncbi:group III truncated hemoglobin [Sphingomonas sp.]|uniref:group III truncated hemoglobin n=1 Tax=Sphingomonas sp. TaxID=28214 RepID=UPI002CB8F0C0|nr:group III truncated hemoglobin [Sphingomonas sp.]HWK36227.1 group III truncated hemoglobin [Sphingomonas sp.]